MGKQESQSAPSTQVDLLHEVAKDRQRIKHLKTARNKLTNAIKAIKAISSKVVENERLIFEQYEPVEELTPETALQQLDLFADEDINQ